MRRIFSRPLLQFAGCLACSTLPSKATASTPPPTATGAQQNNNLGILENLLSLSKSPPHVLQNEPQTKDNNPNTLFVNVFVSFMKHEQANKSEGRHAPLLSRVEQHNILTKVCEIIEQRSVTLVVASRLVKRSWSSSFTDVASQKYQQFVKQSLKAWITEEIKKGAISASDARAILGNTCHFLRGEDVSIVGNLALIGTTDMQTLEKPDALISVLWSLRVAGAHPPREFLQAVVDRLIQLNNTMRNNMSGVIAEGKGTHKARPEVGHVFSGLKTRQIYRLLDVLKEEKWGGDIGPLRDLVDQALKNIVFETEAANFSATQKITKSVTEARIVKVSDLNSEEFLKLLTISGDFEIPFSISAAHVSEHLLVPLVQYADREKLLFLMQISRKTRCHSVPLVNALIQKVQERGPNASYALPLSKGLLKIILRETELFPHVELENFLTFFLQQCKYYTVRVRAAEIFTLSDILYSVSRRFTTSSAIGVEIRKTIDGFAHQLDKLLNLKITDHCTASKVLEHTVLLGMRGDPELFPGTAKLLESRNKAIGDEESLQVNAPQARQRWEDTPENQMPAVSKASLNVYKELLFIFERMCSIKASMTENDFKRFEQSINRAGIYSIFHGGNLLRLGHLQNEDSMIPLPGWIEKQVCSIVLRKIRQANISPNSSNDNVLLLLGHVHCNSTKVKVLQSMIESSPYTFLRRQREVWVYVMELANRFGDDQDKAKIHDILQKCLF